ncbi:hypothetical protein CAL23_16310 [Bordetella genomosp. 6]|uniref:Serine/threonine protein kinase n=1 Tax=Bordetella genomosp. 6 TaxID=463024 RepID=A0ABX4FB73_9BORD|nr:hypothetical protein CAL23_16310 [Bordetella genomosp. 6]
MRPVRQLAQRPGRALEGPQQFGRAAVAGVEAAPEHIAGNLETPPHAGGLHPEDDAVLLDPRVGLLGEFRHLAPPSRTGGERPPCRFGRQGACPSFPFIPAQEFSCPTAPLPPRASAPTAAAPRPASRQPAGTTPTRPAIPATRPAANRNPPARTRMAAPESRRARRRKARALIALWLLSLAVLYLVGLVLARLD